MIDNKVSKLFEDSIENLKNGVIALLGCEEKTSSKIAKLSYRSLENLVELISIKEDIQKPEDKINPYQNKHY